MAGETAGTELGGAFIFPVSVPVGGAVNQGLEFQAEHTVMILVMYILPPLVAALPGLGPFVSAGQHTSILKYLFTDMQGLAGRVGSNGLRFTVCSFSFFRRTSIFFEVLSLRFFAAAEGSSSSSKAFFPWASRSAFTSSVNSLAQRLDAAGICTFTCFFGSALSSILVGRRNR